MLWSLGILALGLLAGVAYQRRGVARDARRVPPPGRLLDIGRDQRRHVYCAGSGPSVIFDAGISASSLSWTHVQPRVAEFARACTYDRAGLAWSDASRGPITASRCADELNAVLHAAAIPAPYVLVGHSYAAFVLHIYAVRHPETVAGIVLVDPIYPAEWITLSRRERWRLKGGAFLSRVGALLARAGVVRGCLDLLAGGSTSVPRGVSRLFGSEAARTLRRLVGEVQKLPPHTWPAIRAHWSQAKGFTSMAEHLAGLRQSAAEVAACGDLPPHIPVIVITAAAQAAHYHQAHARIAAGSAKGRQVVAARSGHWVHLDEPEIVVDAIRTLVDRLSGQ